MFKFKEDMKKQYIQPTMVAIKINGMALLAGSPKGGLDPNQSVNPGSVEAPMLDWDEDEEDW